MQASEISTPDTPDRPGLYLRRMTLHDLTAVLAVERAAYHSPWSQGIFQDSLKAGHYCMVLEQPVSCELIGHGVIMLVVDECHLLNLCIHPSHQRQGLGRLLLRRLLAIARQRQAASAFLEVRASNRAALALYQAEGFNEIGLRRGYYPAAKGREDAIVMGCAL
ncbi:ribosomal-protein-alanine N-acetyltransferase [Thiorhodovibrio winogradskyi]|nr:ribosomal protein S18-alanine N-acetyltransferase [Thiorhodovibrio winogradskyi]MBK5968077.1 ribosomal-protein-alanine N-acetyltransferase [Thiorhodovibrio winogradskyi]